MVRTKPVPTNSVEAGCVILLASARNSLKAVGSHHKNSGSGKDEVRPWTQGIVRHDPYLEGAGRDVVPGGASQSSCRSTDSVSSLAPPNTSRTRNSTLHSGG